MAKKKFRRCRQNQDGCESYYLPWTGHPQRQATCKNPKCLIKKAKDNEAKREAKKRRANKAALRAAKDKIKTRGERIKEAQAAFNAFIRERDKNQPCICCGKPLPLQRFGGGYDCGHYRSIGSAPHLRFSESNAHAQTKHCNRYLSGNAVEYRPGIISRRGLVVVERLEADNTVRKWSGADLIEIKKFYKDELKLLKQNQ